MIKGTTTFHNRVVTRRQLLTTASAVAASTILAACGKPLEKFGFSEDDERDATATPGADTSIQHPTGSDELVLRFETTGGLLPVSQNVTMLPSFSLYGDGRVITQGAQVAIYPAPALPNLRVSRLSEEGIQAILQKAQKAGLLDGDKTYDEPASQIADAGTTVFTVNAGGRTSTVSVYALGADIEPSSEEAEARDTLSAFVDDMQRLQTWLPESAFAEFDSAYQIEQLQLISQPADEAPTDDRSVDPQTKQWPLETPIGELGEPYTLPNSRCFIVEGSDLKSMLDALQDANELTRWQSDGEEFTLYARPLLPDEEGCIMSDGGTPPAGAIDHPTGADDLVLRVEQTGGFVPQEALITRMPGVSLYGDGRMIVTGPQIEIFPPPALPNLLVTRLSESGIQAILQEAKSAGLLDSDATYDDVPVADATTTVFTVSAGGQTSTVSVYALGMGMGGEIEGVSGEAQDHRQKLLEFSERLGTITEWLPESAIVEPETEYQAERLQLVSQPGSVVPVPDPEIEPGQMEWPLSTPLADLGEPHMLEESHCFVVEGDEAKTMFDALASANTMTRWQSEGDGYVLLVRPLLPDEEGCSHPGDR